MRPDYTAAEFAQTQPLTQTLTQPLLAASIDAAEDAPRPRMNALTRVTFCFAWLFGLEPFLSGSADEASRSRIDRH